eukprot:Nk52_evm93s1444 gene=Nk52_evmTU93s1444
MMKKIKRIYPRKTTEVSGFLALIVFGIVMLWGIHTSWKAKYQAGLGKEFDAKVEVKLSGEFVMSRINEKKLLGEHLDNIMIERIPGTVGHKHVRNYIVNTLQKTGVFEVQEHTFTSNTPFGPHEFTNVIATLNLGRDGLKGKRLLLSAHYDSLKLKEEGKVFVGATDSAVPCAILLHIAEVIARIDSTLLKERSINLQLVFFDGEEAFDHWTREDSTYGARALAEHFQKSRIPGSPDRNELQNIELMVLLDLIGHQDIKFYNFFANTENHFKSLMKHENVLREKRHIDSSTISSVFSNVPARGVFIEDDHIPFVERGVPVLHLIPPHFPKFWHTSGDDGSILHGPTILAVTKVMLAFVCEYLGVDIQL